MGAVGSWWGDGQIPTRGLAFSRGKRGQLCRALGKPGAPPKKQDRSAECPPRGADGPLTLCPSL